MSSNPVTLDMSTARPLNAPVSSPAQSSGTSPVKLDMSTAKPMYSPSAVATPPAQSTGPSLGENIEDIVAPQISGLHKAAGAVHDWADRKMDPNNPHMLGSAATFGTGVVRDIAGLAAGATSPEGIATTAGAVGAPEIVGPALVGHGLYNMYRSWGTLSDLKNPDILQNELNSAAEVAGGASMIHEGPITQAIRKNIAEKTIKGLPDQQLKDFKDAIPPTKTAPYKDADVHAARPYLEQEYTLNPIDDPVGLREAADSAVSKIEGRIGAEVQRNPNELINSSPLYDAYNALKKNVRLDFVEEGMKDLQKYPLGWQRAGGIFDDPLTLQKSDDIRSQLNQENKAVLKKNNYDLNTARSTDPAFAAREAVSEALRNGVYDKLYNLGFKDARALRLDEGSLLKIRNASLRQEFNGEKPVAGTASKSGVRKVAAKTAKVAATTGGAAFGAHIAGPLGAAAGAEAGSVAGDAASQAIAPGPMTRSQLLDRSFRPAPKVPSIVTTGLDLLKAAGTGAVSQETNNEQRGDQ